MDGSLPWVWGSRGTLHRVTSSCAGTTACADAGAWINEPEAAGGVQGFSKFPGGPARDVETLKRADGNGLKTRGKQLDPRTSAAVATMALVAS